MQNFIKRFTKEVGRAPGTFEAIAGDAAFITASIMNSADKLDRESIRMAWSKTKAVDSFTGKVGWNGSGEAMRQGVLMQMYDENEKLITIPSNYWGAGS